MDWPALAIAERSWRSAGNSSGHGTYSGPSRSTSPPDYRARAEALTGISLRVGPACHLGDMIIIERLLHLGRAAVGEQED